MSGIIGIRESRNSGNISGGSFLGAIAPGADGQVLTSTGSAWNSEAVAASGKVLQVQSFTFTPIVETSTTSFIRITDPAVVDPPYAAVPFEKAITVVSGSDVLILYDLAIGSAAENNRAFIRLNRVADGGSTEIGVGGVSSDRTLVTMAVSTHSTRDDVMTQVAGSYLDTNAFAGLNTYALYWMPADNSGGGYTVYINRAGLDTDIVGIARAKSTITLMEIGA